jgi:hypothetical protein
MDWSYMNPSFLRVPDTKMFLALYSLWVLFWKELKIKSRIKRSGGQKGARI